MSDETSPRLICFHVEPGRPLPEIRPAARRRDWMDETFANNAYRCLPLVIACQHGWEIVLDGDVEATWTGGAETAALEVHAREGVTPAVRSHFGDGVLTFNFPALFQTPPGMNLWVSGPVNALKDGIQALSAMVETDWNPLPFTMNWRFTRPGTVRFAAGEPICQFFPVPRGLTEAIEPEIRPIATEAELQSQYAHAKLRRTAPRVHRARGLSPNPEDVLQKWYMRGEWPDGSGPAPAHQTRLDIKPFRPEESD